MTNLTDLYAVIGNPVKHSLSPEIFKIFAQQTQQPLVYQKLLSPFDQFHKTVQDFQRKGGKGLNITLPFKKQAFLLANKHHDTARLAQSANTLIFSPQGDIIAANTDGVGLIHDIENNHQCNIKGQRILLIGAGGAATGVIAPLLAKGPSKFHIVNRTVAKALALAKQFDQLGKISASGFDALTGKQFDLIINATSASLYEEMVPLSASVIAEHCTCYDMVYSPRPTVFLQWAQKNGATHCIDGLGMLVEQAAASFYLWRGIRPETQTVIQQLKNQLFYSLNIPPQ